jgi:hypothetical protein
MSGFWVFGMVVEKIREIFEEFAVKEVALRNEFAAKKQAVIDKYDCALCKKECDLEDSTRWKCVESRDKEVGAIEDELSWRMADLYDEVEERVKQLGLEVELNVHSDANCFFNAPGRPGREYRYYTVWDYHNVIDKKNKKAYRVCVKINEYNKPWETTYSFEGIEVDEMELVDESVPFTDALADAIPWSLIRPEWSHNIESFVQTLAKAEREGRLNETLKEIEAKVKANLWIYDYAHFYNALKETCKKFNINL